MSVAGAAALGLGLGVVTGMPLGVINVAIVDAAIARERDYATGLGLGGAVADTVHALLAFAGVGAVIAAHPALLRVLAIIAALVITGYAITTWRRHQIVNTTRGSGLVRGAAAGAALTLPNPGALGAWIAVAAALWPDASRVDAIALALGVGLGSAIWFTALGWLVARVPREHRALRAVPRVALIVLVAIALAGVARSWA